MTATQVGHRESEDNSCWTPERLSVLPEKKASERDETPQPFPARAHLNGRSHSLLLRKSKTLTEGASSVAT